MTSRLDEGGSYNEMIVTEYANLDANGRHGERRFEAYLTRRGGFEKFPVRGSKITQDAGINGPEDKLLIFYYDW